MREKRELALQGMQAALDRALDARKSDKIEEMFAPLAEALWWIVVLNDSYWQSDGEEYRKSRDSDEQGRILEGLRYARNRLTHDIDITGMHGLIESGLTLPFNLPANLGRIPMWMWRSVDKLPRASRRDRESEARYRESLEGKEVEATLQLAATFLSERPRG